MSVVRASAVAGNREEKLAELRKRLAALPDRHRPARSPSAPVEQPVEGLDQGVLPVHPELARLLPGGGLPRGSVAEISGAASLAVSLVATASRSGARVALCGLTGFGMAAALEQGADPERIALIEGPLADPVSVASVLLDGADVVLCGLGGLAVPPSRGRAVAARARSKGGVLLVTGGRWEGASLHLGARVQGYAGLGARPGRGRVRGIDLLFSARGRGCLNPYRGVVEEPRAAVAR
ncbi:hypothetical protein [Tsukamurella sp. 1534]|uniref:hypothetical protein n=1 Tax=Tsukamurella sp. 1534 TaxID=1151061 RepID=UPI0011D1F169|nr:hypothetical protein [Tsukamurella sp. 1534]